MEQTVRLNILILEASIVSDLFVVFVKFWLRFVKRLFDGISCYPAEAASASCRGALLNSSSGRAHFTWTLLNKH